MDFFDGGLSEEQLRVGLTVAAVAVSISVVAVALLVAPRGVRVDWAVAGWALASIGMVISYIAVKLAVNHRRHGTRLDPWTVFVLVLACVAAIALLNVAADGPATWTFEPMFIEVPVFVCLVGNSAMRRVTLAATVVGMSAATAAVTPATGPSPWPAIVLYGAVLVIVDHMVGAVMVSIRGRNSARGTITQLMEVAAEADRLDDGLAACLPLVDGVIPASGAAVVTRRFGGAPPALVSAWAPASPDEPSAAWRDRLARADDDPDLAAALGGPGTVITDRWCGLPIGYGTDGELVLLIDRRVGHGYQIRFAQEATDALSAAFLRLTARLAHLDQLRQESATDPLTGLPNRRLLLDRLPASLAHSDRSGEPLTVAMLDLDRFKDYNDAFGHLAGDDLLRSVAGAVAGRMRAQDVACRYGGDELCLVLPGTDAAGAHQLLEDVRHRVAAATAAAVRAVMAAPAAPVVVANVTVSAGAAVWDGSESAEALMARADAALLRAKRQGRDTVAVATPAATHPVGPPGGPDGGAPLGGAAA